MQLSALLAAYVALTNPLSYALISANAPISLPWAEEGRYSRSGAQYDVNQTSCANAATTTLEAAPGGNVPAVFGFGALVVLSSDARVGFTVAQWPDVTLGAQTGETAFLATTALGSPTTGRATGSPIYASEKHDLVVEPGSIRAKGWLYSGRYCSLKLTAANTPGGQPLNPPCNQNTDCTGSGAGQFNIATATCVAREALSGTQDPALWEAANGGVIVRVRNDSGAAALVVWDLKR